MRANIKGRGQSEPRGAHANQVKPNWTRWRPSTIPNAGDGLFATRKLAIHTILGVYRGESISKAEVLRRYPGGFWPYVHSPGGGIYIDAIDPQKSNHMRYINSPHGTRKSVNCTFRGIARDHHCGRSG